MSRSDSLTISDKKEHERLEKRKKIEDQSRIDSIGLDKILSKALNIAEKNLNKDIFKITFVETMPDSSYQVEVNISSDFYFSKQYSHLIIRRNTPSSINIDIFSKTDNKFHKVLSHEQWTLEYTGDTIRDINGDNLNDFVINWYGSNGCCLKAFSDIYLLRSDSKSFSNVFQFINPTFSPKESVMAKVQAQLLKLQVFLIC